MNETDTCPAHGLPMRSATGCAACHGGLSSLRYDGASILPRHPGEWDPPDDRRVTAYDYYPHPSEEEP